MECTLATIILVFILVLIMASVGMLVNYIIKSQRTLKKLQKDNDSIEVEIDMQGNKEPPRSNKSAWTDTYNRNVFGPPSAQQDSLNYYGYPASHVTVGKSGITMEYGSYPAGGYDAYPAQQSKRQYEAYPHSNGEKLKTEKKKKKEKKPKRQTEVGY